MKYCLSVIMAILIVFSFAACEVKVNIIEENAPLSSESPESFEKDLSSGFSSVNSEENVLETTSQSSENESLSTSTASETSKESSSTVSSSSVSSSVSSVSSSVPSSNAGSSNIPVQSSSSETRAVWISYLEYQSILTGKSKSDFTSNVSKMFSNIKNDGFNTVFVHVRSHSDAIYDSDIFPWSVYCTGTEGKDPGYDPLEIMVEKAHEYGLEIEAWVNPYRVKGTSDTSKISKDSPAYGWLDTEKVVVLSGNGIFYNPADDDVIDLVVSGIEEIVEDYDVDGIHFDDYFYPTTDDSIDSSYYSDYKKSGGNLSLAAWRRQNVNKLVKRVYSAIKSVDSSCRFGISPTGNSQSNYDTLYCDVETWVTSSGYVDYICPQIYYGFNHGSIPYLTALDKFNKIITNSDVELIVGLSAYKIGCSDSYAGTGKAEWQTENDILSRQIVASREESHYGGFALYRYDSLYNPVSDVKDAVKSEKDNLKDIL